MWRQFESNNESSNIMKSEKENEREEKLNLIQFNALEIQLVEICKGYDIPLILKLSALKNAYNTHMEEVKKLYEKG